MLRGEIWWASPRLPGGTKKRRPMLVVSDDVFNRNERYSKVMVVHLTSVIRPGERFDWEVEISKGAAGLPQTSVAKCNEVYTLLRDQLETLVGSLPRALMRR